MKKEIFKVPLVLEPQSEGGWTVTSPVLPELITEIDNLDQLHERVADALKAVVELYQDMGKTVPPGLRADGERSLVWFESLMWPRDELSGSRETTAAPGLPGDTLPRRRSMTSRPLGFTKAWIGRNSMY
jgi:antitoxin HicB